MNSEYWLNIEELSIYEIYDDPYDFRVPIDYGNKLISLYNFYKIEVQDLNMELACTVPVNAYKDNPRTTL